MNDMPFEVPVASIAGFSRPRGHVYRIFNYLLGARFGEILMVPIGYTTGDLCKVSDSLPIAWLEVWTVLDAPRASPVHLDSDTVCRDYPELALLTPYGWQRDVISTTPGVTPNVTRLVHPTGIHYARST